MIFRGDIFWVEFDPTVGTEIGKWRPAIILSNNAANKRYYQVTVIPLTAQRLDLVEPFQVLLPREDTGLNKDSKALAEQIRTVPKQRLHTKAGQVPLRLMQQIEKAVKIHLGMG